MLQDQTVPMQPEGVFPSQLTLAMAYVPYQSWEEPLPDAQALEAVKPKFNRVHSTLK
jgi:hypothetical protein